VDFFEKYLKNKKYNLIVKNMEQIKTTSLENIFLDLNNPEKSIEDFALEFKNAKLSKWEQKTVLKKFKQDFYNFISLDYVKGHSNDEISKLVIFFAGKYDELKHYDNRVNYDEINDTTDSISESVSQIVNN